MNPKKYWILTFLAALILLPAWVNGCLILMFTPIYWVLGTILLLVLAYAIFAFGKKATLPDTFLSRYGPFIAPILYTLLAWLIIAFHTGGDFTKDSAGYGMAAFLPFLAFILLGYAIGALWIVPVAAIVTYLVFIALFVLGTWRGKHLATRENKRALHALALILVLAAAATLQGSIQYRSVLHPDPEHPEMEDANWQLIQDYKPFTDKTRLVSPKIPPSLKIDRDYPRLDGAIAFIPIYVAAANAIYQPGEKNEYGEELRKAAVETSATSPNIYHALIEGDVDMIFALEPSVEQKQEAAAKGIDFTLTPIAREAFVFLVNEKNPLNSLTTEQIRAIYSGKIDDWQEVGGAPGKILAFQRNSGSGSQTIMLQSVMRGTPMRAPLEAEYHGEMSGIIRSVAAYRNLDGALGYSFRHYATEMNSIPGIRLLAVDNIAPTVANIRNASYPFTVDIYIVTARPLSENAQKLRDWFLSAEGQQLTADAGYVPVTGTKHPYKLVQRSP